MSALMRFLTRPLACNSSYWQVATPNKGQCHAGQTIADWYYVQTLEVAAAATAAALRPLQSTPLANCVAPLGSPSSGSTNASLAAPFLLRGRLPALLLSSSSSSRVNNNNNYYDNKANDKPMNDYYLACIQSKISATKISIVFVGLNLGPDLARDY